MSFITLRWGFLFVLFGLLFWVWIISNYTKIRISFQTGGPAQFEIIQFFRERVLHRIPMAPYNEQPWLKARWPRKGENWNKLRGKRRQIAYLKTLASYGLTLFQMVSTWCMKPHLSELVVSRTLIAWVLVTFLTEKELLSKPTPQNN